MRKLKITFMVGAIMAMAFTTTQAQDVDEIISTYLENIGGVDALKSLKGMKITAKVNQGGMEIPLDIYQMADGRQMTSISFQGMTIKQGVFDGETLWGTNFQTMKAEKSDSEATSNQKLDANDFPDALIDYKEKGYTAELLGKEDMDGSETFKVKLVKEPRMIDGVEVDDITYYYFDTEAFIPLAQESEINQGPQKGSIQQIKFSDYQEVDGLYFPFSMTQGIKDGMSQPIIIDAIELNPEVADADFAFPEE
ncbi:MAG: outer membrane lipoprotein-sorting protein [bacterium]|nr:outer membrane lipoprotein-sorting protein [bacterium]